MANPSVPALLLAALVGAAPAAALAKSPSVRVVYETPKKPEHAPIAERMLRAAAFMYDHDSKTREPGEADFADVHGLDRQRFYNVLCLAWGADPKLYDFAKDLGKLPEDRAQWCSEEYQQLRYAARVLIRQHVDEKEIERARVRFARSRFAR